MSGPISHSGIVVGVDGSPPARVAALPEPLWLKWAVTILSGNWIQLWALPALQRSQNKIQANQSAKADVDHQNITYVVDLLERVERRLR